MNDAYEIVERHWPYDGPHSDDSMVSAAIALDRLTRYLANATYRPVDSGQALWRVVSGLGATVSHLDQVLGQLASSAAGALADDGSLYDDRRDRPGADTASEVAILLRVARDELAEAAKALSVAGAAASHLGNGEAVTRRG